MIDLAKGLSLIGLVAGVATGESVGRHAGGWVGRKVGEAVGRRKVVGVTVRPDGRDSFSDILDELQMMHKFEFNGNRCLFVRFTTKIKFKKKKSCFISSLVNTKEDLGQ